MKAVLLLDERHVVSEAAFVAIRIWRVPRPVAGSSHVLKYSLAYIVADACVLRYDNEAGKGDHRHVGDAEFDYRFESIAQLLDDFWADVDSWHPSDGGSE